MTCDRVPLRTGPPTREELIVHYPAKFTWNQLKTFVNSGDLGLLKRDKNLQARYDRWAFDIKKTHGSMVDYLLKHRLQWGEKDTLSLLPSSNENNEEDSSMSHDDSPPPKEYFSCNAESKYISIIQNDWPYSVPPEVEHSLIWTRLPIFHPDVVGESVKTRIEQDGLWGFTGNVSPPPSPSLLPTYLPALSDWDITLDKMVISEKCTPDEEVLMRRAGAEVNEFVERRWIERDWETAWFVNPPRLQSVIGLAHIHVFARRKVVKPT